MYELSHFVAEVANITPDEHLPFVGKSAFAHKGGVHVAAMRRSAQSYQHVEPALVGNKMRVVVSDLSGRGNLLSKAEEHGVEVEGEEVVPVLNEIKELEARGFSFEAAEASVAMMLKRQEYGYKPPFELIDFFVNVEHRQGRGIFAEATVKVRVQGEVLHTAAEGNGPVNALDLALRKALVELLSATRELSSGRLQSPHSGFGSRHRSHHPRVDRHAERHQPLEHRRREREHHRSLVARAGGFDGIWVDGGALNAMVGTGAIRTPSKEYS